MFMQLKAHKSIRIKNIVFKMVTTVMQTMKEIQLEKKWEKYLKRKKCIQEKKLTVKKANQNGRKLKIYLNKKKKIYGKNNEGESNHKKLSTGLSEK